MNTRKALGLFLVIAVCGTTAVAQNGGRNGNGRGERSTTSRSERMIADLKLDEKQATEFKKINDEFAKKAEQQRDAMQAEQKALREKQQTAMQSMNDQRNADMKKFMTDDQYKQYLEKQQPRRFYAGRDSLNRPQDKRLPNKRWDNRRR